MPRLGLRVVSIVVTLALALPAAADPAPVEHARAAELKKRGDDLLDAKRYADALAAYDASYALEPSAALLYNRGRALQFLARYPEALDAIERFAAEAPPELRARVPGLGALRDELRARVGTLVVRSAVKGARVLVNERQIGVTPFAAPLALDAGHLSIDAFADGYFPLHREVELAGGGQAVVDLPLVSRETAALVVVRSHVPETRVSLDDRLVGLAPFEAGAAAGTHRVGASKPGYADASTQIVLRAGETKDMWLDPIAKSTPLYARWWFWTAVGVVVVAGAATAIALTVEKSPSGGDYSPGVVRF